MLVIVAKRITREIYDSICGYPKGNNKNMKDYDKNKESSTFQYCDVNSLYGWVMLQKLPATVKNFKWVKDISKFDESFIKSYEESDKGYLISISEYLISKSNLQQTLNHELVLKNLHRVIKLKQKACLKS